MRPTNKTTITVVALLHQNAGHQCSKAQIYLKIYPKEERRLCGEKQLFVRQNAFIWGVIIIFINPLNAELNPICHLLALLGGATIVVVSRLRVKRLGISQKLDNN